jgi:FkbM family methyltransferase
MIEFYKQFIGPDDLVFDIGANIGEVTEVFVQLARKIVAVEPVDESFSALVKRMNWSLANSETAVLVHMACGAKRSRTVIGTSSQAPTAGCASMSPSWIEAVKNTKRFGTADHWDKIQDIEVTALDTLIEEYGKPAFIKIDVEGYEMHVLSGLSQPVKALSFEYTPERLLDAQRCVLRCRTLGMGHFNLSLMQEFKLGEWTDTAGIIKRLDEHKDSATVYGDVYARC